MKRRKIQIDTSSKKGKIEMGVVQKGRSSLPFSFPKTTRRHSFPNRPQFTLCHFTLIYQQNTPNIQHKKTQMLMTLFVHFLIQKNV